MLELTPLLGTRLLPAAHMPLLHGELDLATSSATKWKLHIEPISLCCPLLISGAEVTCLGQECKGTRKMCFSDLYLEKMGPVREGVHYPEITRGSKGTMQPENTTNIQLSITGQTFPPPTLWELRHEQVT